MKTICHHPNLFPTQWNQQKPQPCEMIGCCELNQTCPICGFGTMTMPHECKNVFQKAFNEAIEKYDDIWKRLS